MKNVSLIGLLFLAVIAFQSFTYNTQSITEDQPEMIGEDRLLDVEIVVINWGIRDSLLWFMDVDIFGPNREGKMTTTSTRLKVQTESWRKMPLKKGMKGKGKLNVPDSGSKGTLAINKIGSKRFSPVKFPVGPKVISKYR